MKATSDVIKILLVDDHKLFLDGIASILSDEPNIKLIGKALNGCEALRILEKQKPDIIFMDIQMPVMNGIEATTIITEKYPNIKVIALTTYDDSSIIRKMIEAGVKGYLLKSFSKEKLRDAITRLMKGEQVFDSDILIAQASKSFNNSEYTINTNVTDNSSYLSLFNTLTIRETQVLRSIVNGESNKKISENLSISTKTVATHRNNILKKIKINNTASLVKLAVQSGFVK